MRLVSCGLVFDCVRISVIIELRELPRWDIRRSVGLVGLFELRAGIVCRGSIIIELYGVSLRVGVWVAWRDGLRGMSPRLVFF